MHKPPWPRAPFGPMAALLALFMTGCGNPTGTMAPPIVVQPVTEQPTVTQPVSQAPSAARPMTMSQRIADVQTLLKEAASAAKAGHGSEALRLLEQSRDHLVQGRQAFADNLNETQLRQAFNHAVNQVRAATENIGEVAGLWATNLSDTIDDLLKQQKISP